MKALLLAAGLGTRLRPLTDHMPKALVPVGGQPLLHHNIRRLTRAGVSEIAVNVHHFAPMITDYIASHSFEVPIRISDETERLLDTGGAIRRAAGLLFSSTAPEPLLVHNVDILSNARLDELASAATQADAALLVSQRPSSRNLLFDQEGRLCGWLNVKTGEVRSPYADLNPADCRAYAFAGIHCLAPALLPLMSAYDERFSIIDFYLDQCATHRIIACIDTDLRLLDVGKAESLQQAEAFIATLSEYA